MNSLKKLPMTLTLVGLGALSSFAEIKLTDNLGVSGFLDMSISGEANDSDATLGASFDQLELDFMWKFDKISARADINAHPGTTNMHLNTTPGMSVDLEQAFITYTPGSASFSTGRFLSSSGFEAAEPTGLFQYSYSKPMDGCATGGQNCVYGGYQNGVNMSYTTPMFGLYGAIVSDLWTSSETDLLTPGFEGQVALTPAEGVTAKVAYLYQMYDEDVGGDASQQLLNIWGQYAKGALTAAAEYNMLIDWVVPDGATIVNDGTGHGWLAMANLKFGGNYAATVRYSGIILGDADPDTEITFSPSVTLSPNWLALAEVKQHIDAEVTSYAVESLFSF